MGTVASARSERGETTLLRRSDGALELRVNGVFVMDTVETTTERLLARLALASVPDRPPELIGNLPRGAGLTALVAGLGLGFTLGEVLRSARVAEVIVAEIEPDLVAWHHDGVIPAAGGAAPGSGLLADPRVRVEVADVREVVAGVPSGSVDVIVLDVDNGPGFLVYDANADVYGEDFVARCAAALTRRGVLAVWSSTASGELLETMRRVFGRVDERAVPVALGRRPTTYHLFFGHRLP